MSRSARVVSASLLACALLLAGLLTGCTGSDGIDQNTLPGIDLETDQDSTGLIPAGDRRLAPTIKGEDLDGEDLDVADLRGQVVVLNFWAQWCGPCRAEAEILNEVYDRTQDLGVEFVGINVKDDRAAALAFERVKEVRYRSIYDQRARLLLDFRKVVPPIPPSTLLLDRQGRVAGLFIGAVKLSELEPVVTALAEEPGT